MAEYIKYESWRQFKTDFLDDLGGAEHVYQNVIFRGQAQSEWPLETSFDRLFWGIESEDERHKVEFDLLKYFVMELQSNRSDGYCRMLSEQLDNLLNGGPVDYSLHAYAQHFGVPTRLLDWSTSPYIAAFFAFSENVLDIESSANTRVAIWALNKESQVWSEDRGVKFVEPPGIENVRLRNQRGVFTLSKTPARSLEGYTDLFDDSKESLYQITIPAACASEAIQDLGIMSINSASLFPDAQGAARTAMVRTTLEHTNVYPGITP